MNEKEYEINKNILENFKFKNFKNLTNIERKNLAIKLSNELSNFYGLKPVKIIFEKTNNSFGSYSHFDLNDENDSLIKLNSIFLTSNEKSDCFRFLSTIIHETRHYIQEIQEPEKYLQTIKSPTASLGFYINQMHEKDAFEFEINMLKSMESFFDDLDFDEFIKQEKLEINGYYKDENWNTQKNGFFDNSYSDTLKELVSTYSFYQEPINTLLKCTSGRLNFKEKDFETKNLKGIIVETDDKWSCKLLSKYKPPIVLEFGLSEGTCKVSRIYKILNVLNDNVISTSANENEKFQMLSFLPEIVEEYKKQTKKEINCLDICPYSIDDYSDEYKAFLYHICHKENILDKIFKKTIPNNIKHKFEYNLTSGKIAKEEFKDIFKNDNLIVFNKRKDNIADIFDKRKLDDLVLNGNLEVAKENIDKNQENSKEDIR